MLFLHMLRMLARALVDFPSVISGNWLSVLLPICVFLVTEGFKIFRGGIPAMREHIKRDAWIMAGAYLLLFAWSVVRTVYQDHTDLVGRSRSLGVSLQTTQINDANELQRTKDTLGGEYSELKVNCGIKEGMNLILQKQTGEQQNTINNCQTEALKLLSPAPLKITPLVLERPGGGVGEQSMKWILLINQKVTPARFNVHCLQPVKNVTPSLLANQPLPPFDVGKLSNSIYSVDLGSFTWTPETPIIISISYEGSAYNSGCSFVF